MLRILTRIPFRAAVVALLVAASACSSGPSGAFKRRINAEMSAQNWAMAEADIDKAKDSQYGKKNMVLYYLDRGTVLHHDGKYTESDSAFDRAEQRMVELYTKSVTKAAGTLVVNDNTMDYAGEPFERALTNVYRSLNWLLQGKLDEALVEVRKVGLFLDELDRDLGGKTKYKDDAFAQYLSALLYADSGKMDDARISMEKAMDAYGWYQSLYGTPKPHFEFQKDDKSSPHGELVFIHFNGVAPMKVSKTFQVAWGNAVMIAQQNDTEAQGAQFTNGLRAGIAGNSITISYPEYHAQPFWTKSSEVQADGGQASPTVLMEDVQAIAMKNLDDRMAGIKTRAIARATVKYVLAEVAARAAAVACDRQFAAGSWQNLLCKGGTRALSHGIAAASEVADTRSWGTLPAEIRMARLKLPVGKHTVTVNFKDASGNITETKVFNDVSISNGKRTYLSYRTADAIVQGQPRLQPQRRPEGGASISVKMEVK